MKIFDTLRTIRQEANNFFDDVSSSYAPALDDKEQSILAEIKKNGYHIIPNFYSKSECQNVKNEIDKLIEKYNGQLFKDKEDSDHRIFGADRLSPIIGNFYKNDFIDRMVKAHEKTIAISGLTMAAKMEYRPNNQGSGGGWHRDWAVNKQIKAILYLSDVEKDSGPFQYIEGSQRHARVILDGLRNNLEFNQSRFTDKEAQTIIERQPNKLKTFTGKAGTLILVNTRGIHRGMPIIHGLRYALTNYYWSNMPIPEHIKKIMITP